MTDDDFVERAIVIALFLIVSGIGILGGFVAFGWTLVVVGVILLILMLGALS